MAEFSTFDGSQAVPEPSWWATRSKKAPVGPGVNEAYNLMVKALETYSKDRCYETANVALLKSVEVRDTAMRLPLISTGIKPNKGFFLALKNSIDKLQKLSLSHRQEAQTEKSKVDTVSGKGNDGDDKGGHFFNK